MMTRRIALGCLLAFVVSAPLARAQETINLTVPIARPNISSYTPRSLLLDLSVPRIVVVIANVDGNALTFEYPCLAPCVNNTPASVTALISALNTANLTTRSLWKRVFDRLLLDFPARFVGGATVP